MRIEVFDDNANQVNRQLGFALRDRKITPAHANRLLISSFSAAC